MITLNIESIMRAELDTIQCMILFNPEHAKTLFKTYKNKYSNILK